MTSYGVSDAIRPERNRSRSPASAYIREVDLANAGVVIYNSTIDTRVFRYPHIHIPMDYRAHLHELGSFPNGGWVLDEGFS